MDLKQYVPLAVKTESKIDYIKFDVNQFVNILDINVAATELADMLKKSIFYSKPIDQSKWYQNFLLIRNICDQLMFETPNAMPEQLPFSVDTRLFHCAIGILTEAGEMLTALSNPNMDPINFREELGDVEWYQAIGYDALNINPEDNLQNNIDKLRKRYADKFTNTEAIERDIDAERDVLESYDHGNDNGSKSEKAS